MMATENSRAALLWSGGKNSALALHRALELGLEVCCLATFISDDQDSVAHPVPEILEQAEILGSPLHLLPLSEPFAESYHQTLLQLRDRYKLTALVSGEICPSGDGHFGNNVIAACRALNLQLVRPLWDANRFALLSEMIERDIEARISQVLHPSLPQDWIGRTLDVRLIADLARFSVDLCGENGEYHTMVTSPGFLAPRPS